MSFREGYGSPTRVTFVVPTLEIAGPEQQLVTLVNSLDPERFAIAIVCAGGDPRLLGQVAPHVRVRSLPGRWRHRTLARWQRRAALAGLLAADLVLHRPDVVHCYLPTANVLGSVVARLLGVRAVVSTRMTVSGIDIHANRTLKVVAKSTNRLIDVQVCDSEAARRTVLATERVDAARTVVVHSGTPMPDLSLPPPPAPPSWNLQRGGPAVVCLASLTWRKAHPVLLEAAAAVASAQPAFKLVLMGEGPERQLVERLVKELGLERIVVLAGSVAQAPRLLRHFRFSVLSSSEESFPNALVESMAAGLAIVATRVGGIPELVRDGVDGRLVPPGNPQALAETMLELLERPQLAASMGSSARQRAGELFSVERMAGNFEDLYVNLVAPAAPAVPRR